jgi:hypothetical protein
MAILEPTTVTDMGGMARFLQAPYHFGAMDPEDLGAYFRCRFELERAEREGALAGKLRELGMSNVHDWWWIEASYYRHHFGHPDDDEAHRRFAEQAASARARYEAACWHALSARAPAMLDPAENVSVETWARAATRLLRCRSAEDAERVLASMNLSGELFRRVDEEFRGRMELDPYGLVAAVYASAFASAPGLPRRGPARIARGTGAEDDVAPCTFDRYVEITAAHEAWRELGWDATALLRERFGLSLIEFSHSVRYWSARCVRDPNLNATYCAEMRRRKPMYACAARDARSGRATTCAGR